MDSEDFVRLVVARGYEGAARGVVESMHQPPGRRPAADLKAASEWFLALSPEDQAKVSWVAASAAHAAAFAVLAIMDGATSGTEFDRLELVAVAGDERKPIKRNPADEDLHDIFQSFVMSPGGDLRLP